MTTTAIISPRLWKVTGLVAILILSAPQSSAGGADHGTHDARGFEFSTRDIPFAHELFSVFHDNKLYIADTNADSVVVVNTNGDVVRRIPMPPARIVTAEDLVSWKEQQITNIRKRKNAPNFVDSGDYIRWTQRATGNSVSPRINGMFVDITGRFWMQRYVMPTDLVTYWEQWQQDVEVPIVVLRLPLDKLLLDALEDMVLTSSTNEMGVSSVAVSRLASEP